MVATGIPKAGHEEGVSGLEAVFLRHELSRRGVEPSR